MSVMETTVGILVSKVRIFAGMHAYDQKKMEDISYRIRYHMAEHKISQPKLAEICGCTRDRIHVYVNGHCSEANMDVRILKKMALYFGKEEYYFCNDYLKFIDTVNVPEWLKERRMKYQMSQSKFAAFIGIPLQKYKLYEIGKVRLQGQYWENLKKIS